MMMQHKFVEFIPDDISSGILYVSLDYATAVHKCACGCGEEVVTPITPKDWKLTFNGEAISLHPSIGNWSFKCRSHYFVKNNKIAWCKDTGVGSIPQIVAKPKDINDSNRKTIGSYVQNLWRKLWS